jgi:hypothetical protein
VLVSETDSLILVYFNRGQLLFSKKSGDLIDYKKGGVVYLVRECVDAVRGSVYPSLHDVTLAPYHNLTCKFETISWEKEGKNATVSIEYIFYDKNMPLFLQKVDYIILPGGTITVYTKLTPLGENLAPIPRIGLTFKVPKKFDRVTYYGAGGYENYPDLKAQARLGIYKHQYENFSGNRTDVRHISIKNEKGQGLTFVANAKTFNVNAQEGTTLSIDGFVNGAVLENEEYILKADREYEFSFTVMPSR